MIILLFFLCHWFLSLFSQTFFLHRYSSHKMFKMEPFWEKFFYLILLISQGSSFLNPRAYAILHRMHHAYSDTEKDPHSPHFFKDVFGMMIATKNMYMNYLQFKIQPEPAFQGNYPEWPVVDKIGNSCLWRITCGLFYIGFYLVFANHWWLFILLPIHFLMGPLHGAIVNWCGHKYGYSNHDNEDHSKNSLPWDFLLMGELFQNNHHKKPNSPNFASKWWEFDPTYPVMKVLHWMKIIKIRKVQ